MTYIFMWAMTLLIIHVSFSIHTLLLKGFESSYNKKYLCIRTIKIRIKYPGEDINISENKKYNRYTGTYNLAQRILAAKVKKKQNTKAE